MQEFHFIPSKRTGRKYMKAFLMILGTCLILAGSVWFLQGINLLPGSFMTGQIEWAIYGGLAIAAGAGLLLWTRRHR
jgi:hypothetical protein